MEFLKEYQNFISTTLQTTGLFILIIGVALFIAYYAKRITKFLVKYVTKTYANFIGNIVQLSIAVLGIVVATKLTNIEPTILLALVAILTAGVSLALDGSVKDLIAGIKILIFNYFKVDDYVSFDNLSGVVLELNAFSTKLNVQPQGLVIVPNSKVADGIITNHTALPNVRYYVDIPIHAEHDRRQAIRIMLNTAAQHPQVVPSKTKVFHRWNNGERYSIQLEVTSYKNRKLIGSEVSVLVTEELLNSGFPVGDVTYYRKVE